jgi:hypothetical protein
MRRKRFTEEQIVSILKKIVAEQALDIQALKGVVSKKF